ncbi:MAG: MFS transporter [Sedimentisphaerales bacterium]|nr:MFS transporter [Sedimentisphaerales bacterium]
MNILPPSSRPYKSWWTHLSRFTRLTLNRELAASIPLSAILAVLDNSFCGFIGRKALNMSDFQLAALIACNMMGLVLAGPLIGFFHHGRKISVLTKTLVLVSIILTAIAFTPESERMNQLGAYLFLLQVFLAQIGIALVTTLRSSLWRANYPAGHRGKIVVIIALCITLSRSAIVLLYTAAMDHLGFTYKDIYLISGLVGLGAVVFYSRLRIRGEKQTLRNAVNHEQAPIRLFAGLVVLKTDPVFGKFMAWQMLNGFSTMLIEGAVLVVIINDVFESNWLEGGLALTVISVLLTGVTGLVWARIYDRTDIYIMRFYGAMMWCLSRVILLLGVCYKSIEIILISRVITGIAMGCGQLNWRLGHMAFSPPEKDSLYMGAHVSMTGLRGIVAPFLGLFLYRLDCMGPHGLWLLGITAMGQALAGFGFLKMRQSSKNMLFNGNKTGK